MLKLFTLPSEGKIHSPSPFAWKTEAMLRLSGLDFEKEYVADLSKMPKGKVPVLQDGEKLIPDSSLIQRYLTETYGIDLDKHLTPEQKAIAEAFRRMTEEHLYWMVVYNRFVDPLSKPFMMKAMFDGMPTEQAEAIFAVLQENAKKEMYGHGIGRHTQSDIYAFGKGDLDAISNYLGTKSYFFGEELTSVDVSIVPVVANLILTPIDTEIALYARTKANLVAYIERFDRAVFGE